MSVQSYIRKDVSGMLLHIDDCLQQAQKNCSTSYLMIRDWMNSCLKDHTVHPFSMQQLSQPVVLPLEMNHPLPYSLSELAPSQTKETTDSTSVRGVSSKLYGTIKSTPITSRMVSKPYTADTKSPPAVTTPRPPKSRLIDSARKPSPEDPTADRRAIAYQKYRGRLIDALISDCQSRNLSSMGTKSDLIFRLVEDDLSRSASKAKPPLVPKSPTFQFSVPSRLPPSSAVSPRANPPISPRGNIPLARALLSPVKLFTHTTEQTSQLAAENSDPLGERGQRREVPEKGGFAAAADRKPPANVLLESSMKPVLRETKLPPDSSLQLHEEARDMRPKLPVAMDMPVTEPAMTESGGKKRPEIDTHALEDEDTELWFEPPLLDSYIRKQAIVDPDIIFAPITSCNLNDIFPDAAHSSSEGRGSSGNWDDEGKGHARRNSFSKATRDDR